MQATACSPRTPTNSTVEKIAQKEKWTWPLGSRNRRWADNDWRNFKRNDFDKKNPETNKPDKHIRLQNYHRLRWPLRTNEIRWEEERKEIGLWMASRRVILDRWSNVQHQLRVIVSERSLTELYLRKSRRSIRMLSHSPYESITLKTIYSVFSDYFISSSTTCVRTTSKLLHHN